MDAECLFHSWEPDKPEAGAARVSREQGEAGQGLDPQNFCCDSLTAEECNFARSLQNLW